MSIEAMKLALEAVQDLRGYRPDIDSAIETLRNAIQQAEEQQPDTGEPVGEPFGWWFTEDPDVFCMPGSGFRRFPNKPERTVECLALYTHQAPSVFLVRDVASLLGASVPDVCNALAELGYEPRRSTNAAISPDEAIAVAKRINPAPSVPADVARDAEWYRLIRDGSGWPAVFAAHDAPEPLRGDDLDAAMLAAK